MPHLATTHHGPALRALPAASRRPARPARTQPLSSPGVNGAQLFAVPRPGPHLLPGARRRGPAGGRTPRRRKAPGIGHSPGRGAAGAALNKKGKSEHANDL
jgi:hypothetical protein